MGLLCFRGLGGVLLGPLRVMTPSMLKSLYLAMVGVTNFCHEGARCVWGSWLQNFDVILVINPYLVMSFCCYFTPFDFDDIVRMGVEGCFSPV